MVSWFDALSYANALSASEGLQSCYTLDCTGTPGVVGACSAYTCTSVTFAGLGCTGYRLPTEAEFEYAARAGTTGAQYGPLDNVAWYQWTSGDQTHGVGEKRPNAFTLFSPTCSCNVWEWIRNSYYLLTRVQ